jgi:histidine ammonia-lyase
MGSIGALKLLQVYQNVEHVLAIELFTAAQALDFRKPLRPGRGVELAHECVRDAIPHARKDHYYGDEIQKASDILKNRTMVNTVEEALGLMK